MRREDGTPQGYSSEWAMMLSNEPTMVVPLVPWRPIAAHPSWFNACDVMLPMGDPFVTVQDEAVMWEFSGNDPIGLLLDTSLAREYLGWKIRADSPVGLSRTWEWISSSFERSRPKLLICRKASAGCT